MEDTKTFQNNIKRYAVPKSDGRTKCVGSLVLGNANTFNRQTPANDAFGVNTLASFHQRDLL